MLIAQKFRIYPTKEQEIALAKMFGCARFVYNKHLENWKNKCKKQTEVELKKLFPFLTECPAQVLQRSRMNFEKAVKNHFKHKYGWMKFKAKFAHQSITNSMCSQSKYNQELIQFPYVGILKKDSQKFRYSGKLKSITLSKDLCNRYFASLLIDTNQEFILPKVDKKIGLDLGLKHFLIDSNGNKIDNPKIKKQYKAKLLRIQRIHSKRAKGGKNREKARLKLARLYSKINNIKIDFLHKLSKKIVDENQVISIENLNVKGMLKNHSLAESIASTSWSTFINMLKYKAARYKRELVQIDKFYPSSRVCHSCGYKNDNLTLAERSWKCPICNTVHDRDINAAINILTAGSAGLACSTYPASNSFELSIDSSQENEKLPLFHRGIENIKSLV